MMPAAKSESSPLFLAVTKGDFAACRELIEQGCDVDQPGWVKGYNLRMTPLSEAIRSGKLEIVKLLVWAGCNMEAVDSLGSSSLQLAINHRCAEVVRILVEAGCNVNRGFNDINFTPLHAACATSNKEVVQVLLRAGANPNEIELDYRLTPAFYTSSLDIFKLLVQHGLDINLCSRSGESTLHHAILSGNEKLVEFVISCGVELNHSQVLYKFSATNYLQSCTSRSPLYLALEEQRYTMCQLLLQHGCDTSFTREKGDTLLRILNSGQLDLVMILVSASGHQDWTKLVDTGMISYIVGRDIIDQILGYLGGVSRNPFSLKSLARLSVRRCLQTLSNNRSIWPYIQLLPVPSLLKNYLSLKIV